MKFELLYRRRWWLFYLPILALAAVALWWSHTKLMPLPPERVTIAAGVTGGGYSLLAMQYRRQLEDLGVQVSIMTTTQSHSGLQQLQNDPDIDIALVNGMLTDQAAVDQFIALAAIEREPLWVFSRWPTIDRLAQLRGLRIGVPEYDTLQTRVTQLVLSQAKIEPNDVQMVRLGREQLANALIDGQVDAVILLGSIRNDVARSMIRGSGIQLLGFDQVGKLLSREKSLRPFVLPQGAIELRGDVPSRDLTMVAVDLHLLARPDMHPALQRAVFKAATRIHEIPSFLQNQGEFPAVVGLNYPVSSVTLAASRGHHPWLEEMLPYRWAQAVQWLLYAALPILVLTGLLLAWIPSWLDWHANAVLQNFYGQLKFIESEMNLVAIERPIELRQIISRIDEIEQQVMRLQLPVQHAARWYTLRSHLSDARERLLDLRAR